MSDTSRARWEERYATGSYRPRSDPSPFLVEWLDRLPKGRALDIACGTGRNAMCLAAAGHQVQAIDISPTAIARARNEADRRGLSIDWKAGDIEDEGLDPETYDVITVIRYGNRTLWPRLPAALRPGGAVVVEHHLVTDLPAAGPTDPSFRLLPGELLEVFRALRIVLYSETTEPADRGDGVYALARLVAFAGDPAFMT